MHDHTGSRRSADAAAFRQYVEPEIEVLLRVARTLTGSWADAEDLVQETLIRAFGAVGRFDGRHPRAWLLTIMRNTNLNMHRRQRPDTVGDWDQIAPSRPAFGAASPSPPDDIVFAAEFDEDLQRAVADLDPRFRAVLLLVGVDDLTYAETARVLDIPVGTVMSRLHRARDRVRKAMNSPLTSRRQP